MVRAMREEQPRWEQATRTGTFESKSVQFSSLLSKHWSCQSVLPQDWNCFPWCFCRNAMGVSKLLEAPVTVVKLKCSTAESPHKPCGLGQRARKRRCFPFSEHNAASLNMQMDFHYSLAARMSSVYNFCLLVVTPSPCTGKLFFPNSFHWRRHHPSYLLPSHASRLIA